MADVPEKDQPEKPTVQITTDMTRVVNQGQAAILTLPQAPVIFQRGRKLCIIARGVKPPRWLHRPPDAPIIQLISPPRLQELASRAASWHKWDKRAKKGEEWQAALPPSWFVPTLMGRPAWPFPVLEGIIHTPTLRPDGSVLAQSGYDETTGLYLDTNGTTFAPLLATPTRDDAASAARAFRGILQDFPFVGTGFAAALAALLSLVCRFAVQGNVPLFPVRSTVRGSGKGLLIDALSIVGTGRPAPHWPQSDNDEEDRKRLVTVGLAGDACIHIDNVKYPLGSPALDLALTTTSITDRLLGGNEKVEAPLNMVWFASGNNMQFKGDTARRVVPIDLDPQLERPEERTGFAYPRLLEHVTLARPALVHAALTLVQAYAVAGRPAQQLSPYGSFQEWSDLIRSAVVWTIGTDPCEGRKDVEAQSDPAYDRLTTLLDCWHTCYRNAYVSVARAIQETTKAIAREETTERTSLPEEYTPNPETQKWRDLHNALSNFDSGYRGRGELNAKAIGNAFNGIAGRVIGTRRFERGPDRTSAGYPWRVSGVSSVSSQHPRAENGIPNSGRGQEKDTPDTPDTSPPDSEATTGSPSPATTGSSPKRHFPPGDHSQDEAGEVLSTLPESAKAPVGLGVDRTSPANSLPQPGGKSELAGARVPDGLRCAATGAAHEREQVGKEYRCRHCQMLMTPPLGKKGG